MQLHETIQEVFGEVGALARQDGSFKPRAGQTQMAVAVAQTLENGGALVVEAGTGVGKTFAYLVPALLSGERVLVSTATKALQDQIFARDLPILRKALGVSLHAALLKGRSSYVCPYRLELAQADETLAQHPAQWRQLERVRQWAQATESGDITDMPGYQERSPLLPLVTSTRENCLGSQCPQFNGCFVNKARRQALAADLVVINHHLFFADMQVRESGMAELLPSVRAVIVDEAHQFNETGVQFLGQHLGSQQLVDFARDLLQTGTRMARGMADWPVLAHDLDMATKQWRRLAEAVPPGSRLNWHAQAQAPERLDATRWQAAVQQLQTNLLAVDEALRMVQTGESELQRMWERCASLRQRLDLFMQEPAAGMVRWAEMGLQIKVLESPLDIAEAMQPHWGQCPPPTEQPSTEQPSRPIQDCIAGTTDIQRAWIFTSATLGADASLRLFTQACGLEQAQVLQVASPFDYARQAALYIPPHLPKPADPGHTEALAHFSQDAIARLGGRTLILTTTLKALRQMAQSLRSALAHRDDITVLVQGEGSRQQLMDRFRQGSSMGDAGCVLVASASFWEGFDAPGDALQLVVIDKLPFPPPHDPLMQARSRRIEAQGGSAFQELSIPEAAVALKQGAGRLIRRETDQGVLVIGDTRLLHMAYGRKLLASLPPMRRLESEQEFQQALEELQTPPVPTHLF